MNCAMEYKDKEESTTKKRKTLIDQYLNDMRSKQCRSVLGDILQLS